MRISKMNPLPPTLLKKKEALYTQLRSRIVQFVLDLEKSDGDEDFVVVLFEDYIQELIDEALWQDPRNSFTIGVGEENKISFPNFPN